MTDRYEKIRQALAMGPEFLAQCRREAVPLLNAETMFSGRMNQEQYEAREK